LEAKWKYVVCYVHSKLIGQKLWILTNGVNLNLNLIKSSIIKFNARYGYGNRLRDIKIIK